MDAALPIYQRVKRAIRSKIEQGDWPENHKIPSEAELGKIFAASRMTINRALRELTAEGTLLRRQGVGSFVAEKKAWSALFEVHNIAAEIAQRGHQHRAQLLHLERAQASVEEATTLGVTRDHPVFRSRVLHFENELPIQLEERVVNADLAPLYDQHDFERKTAYDYLMRAAALTEGEHWVEAILPSDDEAALLRIETAQPCLQIRRRTWSGKQLVGTARLLCPGNRFHLFGHFKQ